MAATRWTEAEEAVYRANQSDLSATARSLDYWRKGPMGTDIGACAELPRKRFVHTFGDSWMPPGPGKLTVEAAGGGFCSNVMMLQQGSSDLTKCTMSWWAKGERGAPLAFWPKPTLPSTLNPPTYAFTRYPFGVLYLPGSNGGKLLVVGRLSEAKATLPNNFNTTMNGGWACLMDNLDDNNPLNWTQTYLTFPGPNESFHVEDQYGMACSPILETDGYVYFPMQGPSRSDKWAFARVDFDELYGGSMANMEWWGGAHVWLKDASTASNIAAGRSRLNVMGSVTLQGSDQPGGFHRRRNGSWQWTGIPFDWKVRDDPAQAVGYALMDGPGDTLGSFVSQYTIPIDVDGQFMYSGLYMPGQTWDGMNKDQDQLWSYNVNGNGALSDPRAYTIKLLKITGIGV